MEITPKSPITPPSSSSTNRLSLRRTGSFLSLFAKRTRSLELRFQSFDDWMKDSAITERGEPGQKIVHLLKGRSFLVVALLNHGFSDLRSRYTLSCLREVTFYGAQQSEEERVKTASSIFDTYLCPPLPFALLATERLVFDPACEPAILEVVNEIKSTLKKGASDLFVPLQECLLKRLDVTSFLDKPSGVLFTQLSSLGGVKGGKKAALPKWPAPPEDIKDPVEEGKGLIIQWVEEISNFDQIVQSHQNSQKEWINVTAKRMTTRLFFEHPLVKKAFDSLLGAFSSLTQSFIDNREHTNAGRSLWEALAALLTPESTLPSGSRLLGDLEAFPTDTAKTLKKDILGPSCSENLVKLGKSRSLLEEGAKRELWCRLAQASLPYHLVSWESPIPTYKDELSLPGISLKNLQDVKDNLLATLSPGVFANFKFIKSEFSEVVTASKLLQDAEKPLEGAEELLGSSEKFLKQAEGLLDSSEGFDELLESTGMCLEGVQDLLEEEVSSDHKLKFVLNCCYRHMASIGLAYKGTEFGQKIVDPLCNNPEQLFRSCPEVLYLLALSSAFREATPLWDKYKGLKMGTTLAPLQLPNFFIDRQKEVTSVRVVQRYSLTYEGEEATFDLIHSSEFNEKHYYRRGSAKINLIKLSATPNNVSTREKILKMLTDGAALVPLGLLQEGEKYNVGELRGTFVNKSVSKKDEEQE